MANSSIIQNIKDVLLMTLDANGKVYIQDYKNVGKVFNMDYNGNGRW